MERGWGPGRNRKTTSLPGGGSLAGKAESLTWEHSQSDEGTRPAPEEPLAHQGDTAPTPARTTKLHSVPGGPKVPG